MRSKRVIRWFGILGCVFVTTLVLCSCSSKSAMQPSEEQIQSICELATLEVHYNNVAKSVKTAGEGWTHIGEKDRKFWIEYQGTARIGVDLSQVSMETDGEKLSIHMAEAKLLSVAIVPDSWSEKTQIYSQDSFFNSNKITSDDQTAAIDDAQKKMEEEVNANRALFVRAQNRAKKLIEEYVEQIEHLTGKTYSIVWK